LLPVQSFALAQVVRQPLVASQTAPPQAVWAAGLQTPLLHIRAARKLPPLQVAAAQTVEVDHFSHWPAPLQLPSWPQVDWAEAVHRESGAPDLMKEQVPLTPPVFAAKQERQVPPQAVLQQSPSTQAPLVHSFPTPQVVPLPFLLVHLLVVLSQ